MAKMIENKTFQFSESGVDWNSIPQFLQGGSLEILGHGFCRTLSAVEQRSPRFAGPSATFVNLVTAGNQGTVSGRSATLRQPKAPLASTINPVLTVEPCFGLERHRKRAASNGSACRKSGFKWGHQKGGLNKSTGWLRGSPPRVCQSSQPFGRRRLTSLPRS
jgi:hypothetical protein